MKMWKKPIPISAVCMRQYINREEDIGLEGLRKAKEALHPAFMVKKYSLLVK